MRFYVCVLTSLFFLTSMVSAQENPGVFVTYSIEMKRSKVKGTMMTAKIVDGKAVPQGYSFQRVMAFITDDCASGKVGKVQIGKIVVNENRGFVGQRFRARCLGGPHRRIGATAAKVVVTRQEDGRDLAEYKVSENGKTTTVERYR